MAFLFTADGMMKFWTLFQTPEGGNVYGFTKKMQEVFNVSERNATLIWQSFDVAEGSYLTIIKNNVRPTKTKYKCNVCRNIFSGVRKFYFRNKTILILEAQ